MEKGRNYDFRKKYSQVELEWEIQKFLQFSHNKDEKLKSPTFVLGDAAYYLAIFPMGYKKDDHVWISLFLYKDSGPDDQNVSVSFGIKAGSSMSTEAKFEHKFMENGKGWGPHQFLKRSSLIDKIKSDDAVTIVISASVLDSFKKTVKLRGFEDLSKSFEKLFLNGHQPDVKLKVRKKVFDAHKLILGARSPVFNAMFKHETAESNNGVVEISDMDPDRFKEFLLFLYTGNFDHVTPRNALDLYKAAEKFDLKDLRKECSLQMASGLATDNIFGVILLAVTHDEKQLLDTATKYFIENNEDIFVTEMWKTFFIENTEIANDLLVKLGKACKAAPKT